MVEKRVQANDKPGRQPSTAARPDMSGVVFPSRRLEDASGRLPNARGGLVEVALSQERLAHDGLDGHGVVATLCVSQLLGVDLARALLEPAQGLDAFAYGGGPSSR